MSGEPGRTPAPAPGAVVVTGMSGAGRTTSIHAFEDMGYEVVNNLPLSMLDTLFEPGGGSKPIALGVEARTRGFSARALAGALDLLRARLDAAPLLVFLDCSDAVLERRFVATRRRHPLAPAEEPGIGVARERDLLAEIRAAADIVIDTTMLSPHELRSELEARFSPDRARRMTVGLTSFSYKRGAPASAEMVLDCRFLRNPYWDETLRALDGRDPAIQGYVGDDPRFGAFVDQLTEMIVMLLPAYLDDGKVFFSVALGCTGGQHRSVAVAECLARRLADLGWPVSLRHSELERRR
ncbi:RNase adapter RapZ [Limibaculum sp. FT325]|uniref:RNase adapter RapZ n=1 Tax=Thermohalobaculum sediminis TaxID=2939436 RepID=UPI0020BEDC4D|nr:RNase adapter RapZ [Limibaculum sediminis]MCL5777613.1 RNase adapter RapZ [Limibaculum sediminis]